MGRLKTALDESRTLMLGAQILLGFQLQAPFQNAFETLTPAEKATEVTVLAIMVVVLGLLIFPSAYHRIVHRGRAEAGIDELVTRAMALTLAPFALAMGLDLFIAGSRIAGFAVGILAGIAGFVLALAAWHGLPLLRHARREPVMSTPQETSTGTKIEHVLTEARVVLPGAQALLGFQLAIILTDGFAQLPQAAKFVHGAGLACIALSTVLLITPAADHRLGYHGSDDEDFYHTASRLVLAATVFLALGLSADIHVVVQKITQSDGLADLLAGSSAALLLGLWHVWPWWHGRRRRGAQQSESGPRDVDRSQPRE